MDNEQPNNGGSSLRLPQFWAENTEAWFAIAETRFRIKRVDDQQEMFDHVVNALPKESLRTVLDLITEPPEDDPYQQLKDRLCQSHQLLRCCTSWILWVGGSLLSYYMRWRSCVPLAMRTAPSSFSYSCSSCPRSSG